MKNRSLVNIVYCLEIYATVATYYILFVLSRNTEMSTYSSIINSVHDYQFISPYYYNIYSPLKSVRRVLTYRNFRLTLSTSCVCAFKQTIHTPCRPLHYKLFKTTFHIYTLLMVI